MPNKTIYVSDDDLALYGRAQELAGGSLSAAIAAALRRYVDVEEGRREGFDEIIVRVGSGKGRKVRFSGVLLGQWGTSTGTRDEVFRVYRSRTGKFVVHVQRSPDWTNGSGSDNWLRDLANWRTLLGIGTQTWGFAPGESTLEVLDSVAELREKIPPQLYEMVAAGAEQPAVEDLDI